MKSRGIVWSRSDRSRRGIALSWLVLFVLSILLQYGTLASPRSVLANTTGDTLLGGFEIDGDFPASLGGVDWSNAANTGPGAVSGPTLQDPVGNADATVLSNGVSDDSSLADWQMNGNAGAPQKADIGNVYVASHRFPTAASGFFTYVGIERQFSEGTVQYDLEFNQLRNRTNGHGISVPNRTAGDALFTATQLGGGSWIIRATYQVWSGAWDTGSWGPATAAGAAFYGLANEFAAPHPSSWLDALGNTVPVNQFAEMGIDINGALPSAVIGCVEFGALNLRSISSTGQTPELKDVTASIPVNLTNCASPTLTTSLVNGTDSNGTSSLTLDLNDSSVTFTDSATFGSTNPSHLPSGTVTYSVYTNATCAGTASDTSTVTISNGSVPSSKSFSLSSAGTYYVVASYAGDTYNNEASSGCADEVVTVVQRVPLIHVVKSASPTFLPYPGGSVTYTYVVTNTGNVPLSDVTLADDKCSSVAFIGGDTNGDSLLDLTEAWNYECTVSISTATTNIATATGHYGETTVTATDSKTVAVGSQLLIAKSFTGNTGGTATSGLKLAKVGDTLTYTLTYTLAGVSVTNGVITDVLPAGLTYVTGSASTGGEFSFIDYNAGTRTLTWTAGSVTGDGSVTYQVAVASGSFDLPQPLTNVATIDSAETDPDSATADVGVQGVLAETTPPTLAPTLPPTDPINSDAGSSTPGFGLMLALLVIAGIGLVAGQLALTPSRLRRENPRWR